jgi:hypothetical protein
MKLTCSGRDVQTVFDLPGDSENAMTFSLGWLLSHSDRFLAALLEDLTDRTFDSVADALVRLQTGRVESGITDVEVELATEIAAIFEAKRGAELPSLAQLQKYAGTLTKTGAREKLLVALTNATPAYVESTLPLLQIQNVRLLHRSWREIQAIAESAISHETNANKRWLSSFIGYLEGMLQMETRFSNQTYVVALGQGNPEGWSISWIDIVEKRGRYFFPVGQRCPDPPPKYIAFRYNGRLQTIHHVQEYEVFTNPHLLFPEAAKGVWDPHYCLRLGPPIRPAREVRNGPRVNQAAKVWCMLDTLLTSQTISEALTESERRARSVPTI